MPIKQQLIEYRSLKSIKDFKQHKFIISVDALGKKDQKYYGSELHKMGIPSKQVKGVTRDQSNALIRLADSVCGDDKLTLLYKKAIVNNTLKEV